MRLNGQRLFSLVALIATISLVGCIDVPANGPTPPNYRSSIKFFHAGRTVDTIAYQYYKATSARKDSVVNDVNVGADIVRTKKVFELGITDIRYRRYRVDFSQAYEVYVDGALKATLSRGAASGYFDVPSGNRRIGLMGNGTFIDSLFVTKIDTFQTTTRDTIRGGAVVARIVTDTSKNGAIYRLAAASGGVFKIEIDNITTTIETERQYSMYFVGRVSAIEQSENNLARFGKIQFLNTQERLLFQPIGRTDSAIVKFVNAYPDIFPDTGIVIGTSLKGSQMSTKLLFGAAVSRILKCPTDTTYKFFFTSGANLPVDSVSVPVSKSKTYSVITLDAAGVRSTLAFTH